MSLVLAERSSVVFAILITISKYRASMEQIKLLFGARFCFVLLWSGNDAVASHGYCTHYEDNYKPCAKKIYLQSSVVTFNL